MTEPSQAVPTQSQPRPGRGRHALNRAHGLAIPLAALALWLGAAAQCAASITAYRGYEQTFGEKPGQRAYDFSAYLLEANAPGGMYVPCEKPRVIVQLRNHLDTPIATKGRVDLVAYGTRAVPGDIWGIELVSFGTVGSLPIDVNLTINGWQALTLEPPLPERKGGVALVADLGPHGRRLIAGLTRVFDPNPARVQYPKQALEHLPAPILQRMGVRAIRCGIAYRPTTDPGFQACMAQIEREWMEWHQHNVTILAEIGGGAFHGPTQPLGTDRPHLSEGGVMLPTKSDIAWLPSYDEDYRKFVYELASRFGWPKGPVTAIKLWNEPWEGLSIAHWGADMPRYRELYRILCEAVFQARKDAGVDVLVGGADSSSNTWDKLLGEGIANSPFWPAFLDFCSVHYQGLAAPVLYREWNERTHHKGRVLVWDTESWVANTDDRVAGAIASFHAAGYDRAMAIGHYVVEDGYSAKIGTATGEVSRTTLSWAKPMAASISALQHFVGERPFGEILFKNGLPWVYVFEGEGGNAEDGTVVVLGDLSVVHGERPERSLFRTVRSLDEARAKRAMRERLEALPADDAKGRAELSEALLRPLPFTNARLILKSNKRYGLFDFYGNPVPAEKGVISVPLDRQGYYLRGNGERRSFDALLAALRTARIEGLQPVELAAADFLDRIEKRPTLRLRLTNVLNQPLDGALHVDMRGLVLAAPPRVALAPHETKWVQVTVTGGAATPDNRYPLFARFDAGGDGFAELHEEMRVNLIQRRTIAVDGKLDDWKGALPQPIEASGAAERTLEEAAWLPFVPFAPGRSAGTAVGYLAYDDACFYFAAKVADDSPQPGGPRFETRNDDEFFYPEVCYRYDMQKTLMMSETASPGTPDRTFLLQDPEANGRLDGRWQNHPDVTAWAIDLDLPADRLMQVALYVPPHQSWHPNGFRFELSDRGNGRQIASPHLGGSLYNGVYALFHVQGKLRFRFQTAWFYRSTIAGLFFDPPAADAKAGFVKFDFDTSGNWRGKYGAAGHRIVGAKPRLPEGVVIQVPEVVEKQALKWPEGVRRYSYRKWPIFPSDGGGDNIQIAFNAIPPGEDGCLTHLPGRMPGFISYKCSDYQYALNTVAPEYGGGFELWRLESPGMPRKHFYPRQPKHPLEGAVKGARLVTTHDGGTRVTEAAIPWSELPHVRALLDASKPVKFSFRVNHDTGGPTMELAWQRSISRANNHAFHVDWVEHWANEIEFAFERRE